MNIYNLRDRFERIKQYIEENGNFPMAPVLLREGTLYAILDGNHRLAVYFYARGWVEEAVPCDRLISVTAKKQIYWIANKFEQFSF